MSSDRSIIWYSNAPFAQTGYGCQSAIMLRKLAEDNYKVASIANYGLEGANSQWNSGKHTIPLYARGNDVWSNDVVSAHATHWKNANPTTKMLVATLFDVWVFQKSQWGQFPVASWIPIDHNPVPSPVSDWAKLDFVSPIAMSKFGQKQFENLGIKSHYIPHSVDPVFTRTETISTMTGEMKTRDYLKIKEDAFVVGMNAANKGASPSRKAFPENLLAFSLFAQDKDDVVLYLHTDIIGAGGINILDVIKSLNSPETKIKWIDQYAYRAGIPQKVLAGLYSAMDVLLATSLGEGFGIPTLEAQRCSVPVIVTDCAASSELAGPDSWKVGGQIWWNQPMKAWFTTPNVNEIVDALNEAYKRKRQPSKKSEEFAKQYDTDLVYETMWKPTLDDIYSKI